MRPSVLRKHTCLSLSLLLLAAPFAQAQTPCVLPSPLFDNRDGYFVNFEEAPVHPIELIDLSGGGSELWAVNIPDASVVVYNAANPTSLVQTAVIKVGLGPVTIRQRPDTNEVWVVCQSSNSVFIIDRVTRRVIDSIRLTHEPAGLVFDASGEKAWVTLSASNQVAEIGADDREVDVLREFATPQPASSMMDPAHAEEPRALILANDDQDLFVLSNESGNGTTGLNGLPTGVLTDTILDLWPAFSNPNGPLPPDRDVIHFDLPGNPPAAIDHGDIALWRMGSMNFDLKMDSQGEIWVSNMDYNNLLLGEHQFPSGKIAKHRVSHAAPLPATPPPPGSPPPAIDLNENLPAALIGRTYCALPNEMAFSADGKTLYVACYETHNVVVVDLDPLHVPTHRVVAELKGLTLPAATGERLNAGVRGLILREPAGVLYTYSRDNRIQVYQVPVAPGTAASPVQSLPIGFDITSVPVKKGRFHHINARRSASGVQSCNTCHVDGHLDRIAWDLSDFTGDPSNPVPRVAKGTKVTMSLRGIEETPPFHWRGDRTDLSAFNPAFKGLLGGAELTPAEMKDFEAFIFSLSYPSNPRQPEARAYSPEAMAGLANFHCRPAHLVALDKETTREFSCSTCHSLAGFSGTNNQINNDLEGQFADDATQLRGLFDKESDVYDYSSPTVTGHLAQIPATGWGFGNTGFADDPKDFVNDVGVFNLLSEAERNSTVDFMKELDTGIAPAAAYAWTLHQQSATSAAVPGHPFRQLLQDQAEDGHIDLVVRGWMMVGGVPRAIGMLYDPGADKFETSISGVGPFPYSDSNPATADLVSLAAAGQGVFTLLGTPVGMGYRLALDEEMDFLKDGDETVHGATLGVADSDGDQYSDGYEVRLGSNPGSFSSQPPAETVPPQILDERVAWTNSNLAKVRWTTDEESISRIAVHPAGSATVLFTQEEKRFKKQHVLVVRGLTPGTSYDFHIVSEDPASPGGTGNTSTKVLANVALQPHLVRPIHLSETKLAFGLPAVPGGPVPVTATFRVVDQDGQPVKDAIVAFVQLEWKPHQGNQRKVHRTHPSSSSGDAALTFPSFHGVGSGAKIEVFATEVTDAGDLFYFHPLDGQFGFWKQESLP